MNSWLPDITNPHVLVFLGFCWMCAQIISVMPPLPIGSGWWKTWGWNALQIFGASLNRIAESNPKFQKLTQDTVADKNIVASHLEVTSEAKK